MENEEQNDFRLEGTGFAYTLSLINGLPPADENSD